MQSIRASVDDGEPIYVILDNLNHHKNRDVRDWCDANHVELVFTPTYASWANPIEAHFGPLRQFVIANSDHRRPPRARPSDPRLPPLAQRPHPRPASPRRRTPPPRPHPQRSNNDAGATHDRRRITRERSWSEH